MSLTLHEQVDGAINKLKALFKDSEPPMPPPEGATVESLWAMILALQNKGIKAVKPGVEEAVKVILEDPDLAEIPISMIAEIVREVFTAYGLRCKCSESSVRWYQSQRNLEWNIVRRRTTKVEVSLAAQLDTTRPGG
jgi:hypothetical protein